MLIVATVEKAPILFFALHQTFHEALQYKYGKYCYTTVMVTTTRNITVYLMISFIKPFL